MVTLHDIQPLHRTRHKPFSTWLAILLVAAPIVLFWFVWANYAVNVPKWDDHALRGFLANFDQEKSFPGKINTFFAQHNEHRIVYDRLITWLDYELFGKFNYVHLMAVGNLSLIGLLVLFGLVLSRSENKSTHYQSDSYAWTNGFIYLPPVAFLLLNLSQWENMFWGMAALQNFTVILWVVWALYLLSFSQQIGWALCLAVAAILTSGNGILVWPAGLLILLLRMTRKQAQLSQLITWLVVGLVTIGLYFLHYAKPAGNPPNRGSVKDLLISWLAFNGSAGEAFSIRPVVGVCMLLGGISAILVIGIVVYILKKWFDRQRLSSLDYFFVGVAAFLISTSVVVAWTRTGFGINTLITSRYKIYSLLLLALLYTYLVSQLQKPAKTWVHWLGIAFGALLMISSYLTYLGETVSLRQYLLTSQFNWTHLTSQGTVSTDSISKRYLNLAPAFYTNALPTIYSTTPPETVSVLIQKTADNYEFINTTLPTQGLGDNGYYLLAKSAKRTYLFPVRQNQQSIRRALFQPANLFTAGFKASVSSAELEAGHYQLFVLTVSDETYRLYATNQFIDSTGPPDAKLIKNW